MAEPKNDIKNQRVVTFLNRDEVDFLDKMGKDALFSSGTKLSRAKLIAWLIDILKGLNISGNNLKTEKDLEVKIIEMIKQIENSNQPR
jgi:hypothetical protein